MLSGALGRGGEGWRDLYAPSWVGALVCRSGAPRAGPSGLRVGAASFPACDPRVRGLPPKELRVCGGPEPAAWQKEVPFNDSSPSQGVIGLSAKTRGVRRGLGGGRLGAGSPLIRLPAETTGKASQPWACHGAASCGASGRASGEQCGAVKHLEGQKAPRTLPSSEGWLRMSTVKGVRRLHHLCPHPPKPLPGF